MAKIVSTIVVPPMRKARLMPRIVTVDSAELRSTWREKTPASR